MVREKYGVRLEHLIRAGKSPARLTTRASILLKIDEGWTTPQVADALDVSERTVFRTECRHVEEGLKEALRHHTRSTRTRRRTSGRSPPDSLGLQSGSRGP